MATTLPRVQVTIDPDLEKVLAEFNGHSKSQTLRNLALRGAEALRDERERRAEATEFLKRISTGEDDRYDFSISAELHAARR